MNRYFPAIVFVVTSVIGLGMTTVVYRSIDMSSETRFERLADEAVDRVKLRVEQHISLLRAARSFFEANSGIVDRSAFRRFISGLGTDEAYDGIQGIGFARLLKTGQESIAEEQITRGYALARSIWPQTSEPVRAPIVLLEPADTRNIAALAFDMFSEETRRVAMKQALQSDAPVASAPVELVQEITSDKQAGFLVYLRYGSATQVEEVLTQAIPMSGFVYAPFRAGDLHSAALSRKPLLPIVLETYDISDSGEVPLYRSPDYDALRAPRGDNVVKVTEIAGRSWKFVISSTRNSSHMDEKFIAPLLAVLTLLLAGALAATTQAQFRAVGAARQLNELNEAALQQKELMLQEMKHRIKNSIARIMAIARQTVNSSASLPEFDQSFSARMQAMASAQDVLTRSHWSRANLRELLETELQQVFGDTFDMSQIKGPKVNVNEKAAQAFGLTFHELATNALKYGAVKDGGDPIAIEWKYARKKGVKTFKLIWKETGFEPSGEPEKPGFGTRLMKVSIAGELGGEIERVATNGGLEIRISVPARNLS